MVLCHCVQVLFGEQKEIAQLDAMFRMLGTPTEASWPGHKKLKGFERVCACHLDACAANPPRLCDCPYAEAKVSLLRWRAQHVCGLVCSVPLGSMQHEANLRSCFPSAL